MKVSSKEFKREIVYDESPDTSYLEQEEFTDRRKEYANGDFHFLGLCASVELAIPYGAGAILQTIKSPGLWGVESDSGEEHFNEIFQEEADTLAGMLRELGVKVDGRE
jgi:hypothetical protein